MLVINGEMSIGQLVAFNTYLLLIVRPVRRLGFLIGQSSRAFAAGERIFEILDAPVEVKDRPARRRCRPSRVKCSSSTSAAATTAASRSSAT